MPGRTNLVAPHTALIGREDALERVVALLQGERRLVTLLGPPGVGKSRLAHAAGLRLRGSHSNTGVLICDLCEARSPGELIEIVAAALGSGRGADAASLGRALREEGELLLILDNAEQSVDSVASIVGSWLGVAKRLRCLVTSRERLRARGEVSHELQPLANAHAVTLFVERAREARDDFELRDDLERTRVAQIVSCLDGVPLAVELAAAQMVALDPRELLERLDDRLALFDCGERAASSSRATLRGAFDASWSRLAARERSVLAQCAVFRASFSLAAAERVIDLDEPRGSIASALRRLRDRSLLVREARDGSWYRLLSNVLAYARERLAERHDAALVFERHARFHVMDEVAGPSSLRARSPAREPAANGPSLDRHAHQEDLGAVVERGLHGQPGVTLAYSFRALIQLANEAYEPPKLLPWLEQALAKAAVGGVPDELIVRARLARGRLRLHDGQRRAALEDFRAVAATTRDRGLRALALCGVGNAERQEGRFAQAERAYRQALACRPERTDPSASAQVLASLGGLMHERGRLAAAGRLHERALARYRALGDVRNEAVVLQNGGLIAQEQGLLTEAQTSFEQALRLHVALGNRRFEGIALFDLAGLALERSAWTQALELAGRARVALQAVNDRRQAALALALRGASAAALGQLVPACEAFDVARAELSAIGDQVFLQVLATHRGHLALALARGAYTDGADDEHAKQLAAARSLARAPKRARRGSADCDELRFARRILQCGVLQHRALARCLFIAADHSWLRGPHAPRVDLAGKKVLQRLIAALADRRLHEPRSPLARGALIHAAWPDERIALPAARNRLQVALTQLRKVGLGRTLQRHGDGYLLDPDVAVFAIETLQRSG